MKSQDAMTQTDRNEWVPTNGWSRFWFSKTDPSTLGFMRIIVGLLLIYLQVAYFFDYQDFFGKHAWWGQAYAEKHRTGLPMVMTQAIWDDPQTSIRLPETAHRRAAIIEFLRTMPESVDERKQKLRFLMPLIGRASDDDVTSPANLAVGEAIRMASETSKLSKDNEKKLREGIAKEPFVAKDLPITLPGYLAENASAAERTQAFAAMFDFLQLMATRIGNTDEVDYVFSWLRELTPDDRKRAIKFMLRLPDSEVEREPILDSFYVWNTDPRQATTLGRNSFSFWYHVSDPTTMWTVYGLHLAVMILFTLGCYTRITSVLTWIGFVNTCHRNPFCLYGMDAMMSLMLFYMTVGPSGSAFSIDRLRARYRASRAMQAAKGKIVPWAVEIMAGPVPSRFANCIVRLMQVHYSFMYLSAGFSKLKGTLWWNMTAPWYVMANAEFCPTHFKFYEMLLHHIAESRLLVAVICVIGCIGTLSVEIGLPFLIWTRLRSFAIMGSVLLHVGIDFFMGLSVFSLVMHSWILCFFPAALIREKVGLLTGGNLLKLRWNPDDPQQAHTVAVIQSLDLTNQTRPDAPRKGNEPHEAVIVVDSQNQNHTGSEIAPVLFRDVLLLQMVNAIVWIPGGMWVFRKVLRV